MQPIVFDLNKLTEKKKEERERSKHNLSDKIRNILRSVVIRVSKKLQTIPFGRCWLLNKVLVHFCYVRVYMLKEMIFDMMIRRVKNEEIM
jgi:hypothetical protein